MSWLLIAVGAAVGAPARYLLDGLISRHRRGVFPTGTVTINVIGSALLGAFAAELAHSGMAYAALATGFCGAFTTFSTFTWETVALAEDGLPAAAVANVAVSVVLGLGAASMTYWLLR